MAEGVGAKWVYTGPFIWNKRGAQASAGGKHSGGAMKRGRKRFLAQMQSALAQGMKGRRHSVWDGIS